MGIKTANYTSSVARVTNRTDLVIQVNSADGFPDITRTTDYTLLFIGVGAGIEIVKANSIDGVLVSVERGVEGTTALDHPIGTKIEIDNSSSITQDLAAETGPVFNDDRFEIRDEANPDRVITFVADNLSTTRAVTYPDENINFSTGTVGSYQPQSSTLTSLSLATTTQASDLVAYDVNALTTTQIASIDTTDIQALTTVTVEALTSTQIAQMTPSHIVALIDKTGIRIKSSSTLAVVSGVPTILDTQSMPSDIKSITWRVVVSDIISDVHASATVNATYVAADDVKYTISELVGQSIPFVLTVTEASGTVNLSITHTHTQNLNVSITILLIKA